MKVPYGSLCPYVTPLTGRCTWKRHLSVGGLLPCLFRVTRSHKLQPAEENEGSPSAQREEQAEEEEEQGLDVHVTETEPQGQADEGELIPRIVEQMHNEDEEAEQMEQCGDLS